MSLSVLNPAQVAAAAWYSRHCAIFHVAVCQMVAEPSLADVINYCPFGLNDAHITLFVWLRRILSLLPLTRE